MVDLRAGFALHPNLDRDRFAREPLALRQNRHALDHVAQLARVARPGVAFEHRKDGVVELFRLEVIARAEIFEEIFREQADIVRALSQARARESAPR